MEGGLVEGPDVLQNVRVEHQGAFKGGADGLLGQIVIGGAQTAGGDEDVRPAAGDVQRLLEPLGVVSHHRVPEDVDAQGGEAWERIWALVLAMLPRSSSVPTAMSSAVCDMKSGPPEAGKPGRFPGGDRPVGNVGMSAGWKAGLRDWSEAPRGWPRRSSDSGLVGDFDPDPGLAGKGLGYQSVHVQGGPAARTSSSAGRVPGAGG